MFDLDHFESCTAQGRDYHLTTISSNFLTVIKPLLRAEVQVSLRCNTV